VGALPTCAQFHYLVENHEMTRDAMLFAQVHGILRINYL
jgi:hypothetical protein